MMWGIVPGLLAQAASGVVVTMLATCLGELASALPFSGGIYGYVRLTIGRNAAIIAALLQTIRYADKSASDKCGDNNII